jgi:hypothetical protein
MRSKAISLQSCMADNGTLQLDLRSIVVIDVNEYDVYYLAELKVRDFTSYRSIHSFLFCRGLNLVQGSCRCARAS